LFVLYFWSVICFCVCWCVFFARLWVRSVFVMGLIVWCFVGLSGFGWAFRLYLVTLLCLLLKWRLRLDRGTSVLLCTFSILCFMLEALFPGGGWRSVQVIIVLAAFGTCLLDMFLFSTGLACHELSLIGYQCSLSSNCHLGREVFFNFIIAILTPVLTGYRYDFDHTSSCIVTMSPYGASAVLNVLSVVSGGEVCYSYSFCPHLCQFQFYN
jgi:hypothetical protein